MAQNKRIVFYYLSAFSATGGIERFNRCFIKALDELSQSVDIEPAYISAYDDEADPRYLNQLNRFFGFNKRRIKSALRVLKLAQTSDVVILGHINLAAVGVLVKLLRPKCKLILIAHGIESWNTEHGVRKLLMRMADKIFSVSNFTKNQLVLRNNVDPGKILLFPNTIDPYFNVPVTFGKQPALLNKLGLHAEQPILLTVSRLFSSEQFKGYDLVIKSLPELIKRFPNLVYILAGKYDEAEKNRLDLLIRNYQVEDYVLIPGYLASDEITDFYTLADVFVMPSRKEGFGIVFLEALACGTAVIGGNQDGTVDALRNGSLGTLINPTKHDDIITAVTQALLSRKTEDARLRQQKTLEVYQFSKFREKLRNNLNLN